VFDTEIIIQLLVAACASRNPDPDPLLCARLLCGFAEKHPVRPGDSQRLAFYLIWKAGGRQYFSINQARRGSAEVM